jgi:hypothetical protein
MQLHTYAMGRLARWAIYCLWEADLLTRQPGPRDVKSWWFTMIMSPNVRVTHDAFVTKRKPCPVDDVEAGITDLCVRQLPGKLRDAVVLSNLAGGTAEEKALALGCDRATYFRRVSRAYAELLGLFNDHEAGVLRVSVDQVNATLQSERIGNDVGSGAVRPGVRKPPLRRGISRDLLLDKNATLD